MAAATLVKNIGFIFTAWCYASVVYAIIMLLSLRPSVHLSVTKWHSIKMAKSRIMQTTPYNSPMIQIFSCQKSRLNSNGVTYSTCICVQRGCKYGTVCWNLRNGAKQRHSYYVSLLETRMRSIEWCYFQRPWMTLATFIHSHFRHFLSLFIFSYWVEVETSNLVDRLIVASDGKASLKGA